MDDGVVVGEDADDVSEAPDLLVDRFQRVGGMDLGAMIVVQTRESGPSSSLRVASG